MDQHISHVCVKITKLPAPLLPARPSVMKSGLSPSGSDANVGAEPSLPENHTSVSIRPLFLQQRLRRSLENKVVALFREINNQHGKLNRFNKRDLGRERLDRAPGLFLKSHVICFVIILIK